MKNILILLTAPPVIAIPIYVITRVMSMENRNIIPFGIWILLIIFVIASTIMYIWASFNNIRRWLIPIQFIAQGGIMSVLAIQSGSNLMTWVGVLSIIIGLIQSGYIVFSKSNENAANYSILSSYDIFESYPFPACVSDKNGSLISISNGLTQLIGKNKNDLFQTKVDSFIPASGKIRVGGKILEVNRQETKDRTWYTFSENRSDFARVMPEMLIQDTETDIFSREYCRIRTEEEIVRIKRYQRWAVFMLARINFIYENHEEDNTNRKYESEFFRSFCMFVKNSLRNCDSVSRVDEFSVFIILPETLSDEPVNGVINKLLGFSDQLSNSMKLLECKVVLTLSHIFYNTSSSNMSFNDILVALIKTLAVYEER